MNKNKIIDKNKKNKTLLVVLSTLYGIVGVDRLYAGQPMLAILKFFTLGGLGLWYCIDLFKLHANCLKKSKNGVFGIDEWSDKHCLDTSYYVSIALLSFIVVQILYYKNSGGETKTSDASG